LHFKASLGSELVQTYRFVHYAKKASTYTVKVERISTGGAQGGPAAEFKIAQASIAASAADSNQGVELAANVTFEPNNIGESRAILLITNPDGAEYSCLLYGHGTAPQPQPITKIMHTKTAPIDFKNPLSEKCEFTIRFDNPCFTLATKLPGPIEAGKPVSLQVKYDYNEAYPSTGRMLISTKDLPAWVYYLHGEK
jgi:hydrocephalus-inducing protein